MNSDSLIEKLEIFWEMTGGSIVSLSNKNNVIIKKIDAFFCVMQNKLENCLFLFTEDEFLNYKNIINEYKTEILRFYDGYNFNNN